MAIKAQSSNQVTKITVKQSRQNLPIELGQSAQHFNNLSELWATSPNIVENKDYSSKYYAEISKQKAQEATEQIEAGEAILNELNTNKETLLEEINTTAETCINSLEEEKNNCTSQIINTTQEATNEITNMVEETVKELEEVKNIIPMFSHFWSDHIYNDVSYLRADNFSWHYETIYATGYDILEKQYNNEKSTTKTEKGITYKLTPDKFKIADPSQEDAIRTLYETEGIAWFYILDTENKRFKLPRTKWGFVGVRDEVGKPVEAELPNIVGNYEAYFVVAGANKKGTGAFADNSTGAVNQAGCGSNANCSRSHLKFDASNSNPIYKDDCDTVQQPATQQFLYFYVGAYKKPETEINLGQMSEALNNKIDVNFNNITQEAKIIMSSMPMPSDNYIDLTLGANGTDYTAPANGYFYLAKAADAWQTVGLIRRSHTPTWTDLTSFQIAYAGSGNVLPVWLPVKKGDVVGASYNATGATQAFRFFYAEGEVNE